jgi:hypothetical protein
MGLHAWVRVLEWLARLEGGALAQPARERATVLARATDAAAEIVAAADGLTPEGESLVAALCRRTGDR